MEAFWHIIISNSVVACGLAVVAVIAARLRVSPAVVHVLLLLAILKLFTPPMLPVSVPVPGVSAGFLNAEAPADRSWLALFASDIESYSALEGELAPLFPVAPVAEHVAAAPWRTAGFWQSMLLTLWITGGALVAGWYAFRITVMRRLIRSAQPAPAFINDLARKHANRLGLARLPEVLMLPVCVTPAVWSVGRPKIVFPAALVEEMSQDRLETLLVHELAHIKRRDHLIRLVELIAIISFWWHPLVWWTRRQLREMEERACDALVLRAVPNGQRTYATALLETLEFLNAFPRPLPIVATAASPTVSLQRRFAMMKNGSHRTATRGAILFTAAVCLPAMTLALAAKPAQPDEASAGIPADNDRVLVRQTDGEHQMVVRRRSAPEQRVAALLGLDLDVPTHREVVEILVGLGVTFDAPEANAAEGVPGGRVLFRNGEQIEGQPMMLRLGDSENADGKRRIIMRNGENVEGQPMMLRLRNGADGKDRVIMLKDVDTETLAATMAQIFKGEHAEGGPMMLRRGDGEHADGERRVIIRNGENGAGERKILIRDHAAQE